MSEYYAFIWKPHNFKIVLTFQILHRIIIIRAGKSFISYLQKITYIYSASLKI